jgi:hypothetical protein
VREPTIWLEFLYDALHSEHGIVIAVSDIVRGKQALYRARADAKDPALDTLKISVSPIAPDTELWIRKNG